MLHNLPAICVFWLYITVWVWLEWRALWIVLCVCVRYPVYQQHLFQHDRSFLIANPIIDQATSTRRDLPRPNSTQSFLSHIHSHLRKGGHSSTSHSLWRMYQSDILSCYRLISLETSVHQSAAGVVSFNSGVIENEQNPSFAVAETCLFPEMQRSLLKFHEIRANHFRRLKKKKETLLIKCWTF